MATITMNKTNLEWDMCLRSLRRFLNRSDLIGYISARNSRKILDALKEYHEKHAEVIDKVTAFHQFRQAMYDYNNVDQKIDILTLSYDEIQDVLTSEEILSIDFMLID